MRRATWIPVLVAAAVACSKIPTKEKSRTPGEPEQETTFTPDPEPWDGAGQGFEGGGGFVYEGGCPDARPEAGADCIDYVGAPDCMYLGDSVIDGGVCEYHCACKSIPEADWWACQVASSCGDQ